MAREKVSSEEKRQVLAFLDGKAGGTHYCPVCHTKKWEVFEDLLSVPVFGSPLGQVAYINVGLYCDDCGHVQLFGLDAVLPERAVKLRKEHAEGKDGD